MNSLRPHQSQAVQASMSALLSDRTKAKILMPVGSGRTAVIAEVAVRLRDLGVPLVLVATTRAMLVHQLASTIGERSKVPDDVQQRSGAIEDKTVPSQGILVSTTAWAAARVDAFPTSGVLLLDDIRPAGARVEALLQRFTGGCLLYSSAPQELDDQWENVYELDEEWSP